MSQSLSENGPTLVITDGVVVGAVIEVKPHPVGERIWLANVDIGTDKLQIVFGGRDGVVHAGRLVPVAPPGSRVPARRKRMRVSRFRGEMSHGMLCSLVELGWALECPDEVALLGPSLRPGDSLDGLSIVEHRQIVVNEPVPGEPVVWPDMIGSAEGRSTMPAIALSLFQFDQSARIRV